MVRFYRGEFTKEKCWIADKRQKSDFRKGRWVMARKHYNRFLSGGVIAAIIVLFCILNVNVQAFEAQMVTYTISGSIGLGGVEMKGITDNGQPVFTDASGFYTATVRFDWTGTITPTLPGYTFEPRNRPYRDLEGDQINQDYTFTPITYTISGSAGMPDVELIGFNDRVVTGSNGSYTATVNYGFSGVITAAKDGYEFTPPQYEYTSVNRNFTNQNFTGELLNFEISGNAGSEGVVLNGLPGNPRTDKDGNYTATVPYDWSGTVTPVKEGSTFEPSEMSYTSVTMDESTTYYETIQTFTISGSAGLANVLIGGFDEDVYTDPAGYYETTVNYGFSGTITASLPGYTFSPGSQIVTKVTSDLSGKDFTGTIRKYTISGTAGQEGVELSGFPEPVTTGPGGSYSVSVEYYWSGMVVPSKDGYEFEPSEISFPPVEDDMSGKNFTASQLKFTVSGTVGIAGEGVRLSGFPGAVVLSEEDGHYTAEVPWNWSGTVTPQKDGFSFEPTNIVYTGVIAPEDYRNYQSSKVKRVISGTITTDRGKAAEGVSVTVSTVVGAEETVTDASGRYELRVDHGWQGTVTPERDGYTFRTPNKVYQAVVRDLPNQNYVATVKTFTITDVVEFAGTPIAAVTITANNDGGSTTTNSEGKFTLEVPYGWSGEVTPTKRGYIFNPLSRTYTNVTQNYLMGNPVVEPQAPVIQEPTTPAQQPPAQQPPAQQPPAQQPPAQQPPDQQPPAQQPPDQQVPAQETPPPTSPYDEQMAAIQDQLNQLIQQGAQPSGTGGVSTQRLFTYTWVEEDITYILSDIGEFFEVSINTDETVAGVVSAKPNNATLEQTLEQVLNGTPYIFQKVGDSYLVCSPSKENVKIFSNISKTYKVQLNTITATRAWNLLSSAFQPYVQPDQGENGRVLLVTAPDVLANRIIEDIKSIDSKPTQVMLDARIVVLERGNLLNLGVEYGWPQMQAGFFANSDSDGAQWGIQMGYGTDATFTNALEVTLNLLEQNDEARIVSSPQVVAMDGKVARLGVTKEEWFMMTAANTSFYSTSQLQDITSGTILEIIPHIGDDNDITLEMSVEVSDSIPRSRTTDLPVVTRRTADNTVRVKNGGTAIVAGLTENRSSNDFRAVPGLSRLPLVGKLFQSNSNEQSTREMAIFIIANIMPPEGLNVQYTGPSAVSMMNGNVDSNMQSQTMNNMNSTQSFAEPQAPAGSSGNDFRTSLLNSLSRQGN